MNLQISKFVLVAALTLTCGFSPLSRVCWASTSRQTKQAGTVPMDLRDNRVFVNLTAVRPNGTTRKVRFIIDTGGGAVILSESLVRELRLKITGPVKKEEGTTFQPIESPEIQIAGMPLDFSGVPVFTAVDLKNEVLPGLGAEGFLPARVLKKYDVIFDYPAKTFTMSRFGALKHRGTPVPSPIQTNSGFPRIEIKVNGQKYGFLLDTGAAYSMVSQKLIDKWMAAHPTWPHSIGAVGSSNMVGGALDTNATLLRIPVLQWGSFHLYKVGVVSRPVGTFETSMSSMMTGPIVGSLAGNALRSFRVEIDYAHDTIYLEKHSHLNAHDLDTAGIVVRAMPGGEYQISGVARKGDEPLVKNVERGDTLLRVDNLDCTGASLADVLRALRGKPGQSKSLVLERKGRQLTVKARVVRLP